jgi:hypothetical protein
VPAQPRNRAVYLSGLELFVEQAMPERCRQRLFGSQYELTTIPDRVVLSHPQAGPQSLANMA